MPLMKIDGKQLCEADVFETVIEHFPDVIQSVDKEGNVVFVNRAVEQVLGYDKETYLTMNVRDLYVEAPDLEKGFEALKEAGQMTGTTRVKKADGVELSVELRSFAIYDDGGDFLMSFTILRALRSAPPAGSTHTGP